MHYCIILCTTVLYCALLYYIVHYCIYIRFKPKKAAQTQRCDWYLAGAHFESRAINVLSSFPQCLQTNCRIVVWCKLRLLGFTAFQNIHSLIIYHSTPIAGVANKAIMLQYRNMSHSAPYSLSLVCTGGRADKYWVATLRISCWKNSRLTFKNRASYI